jgi:hypothetical protein
MLLIFSAKAVYATSDSVVQWQVPFLGTAEGPEGFNAVDLEQWSKQWAEMMSSKKGQVDDQLSKNKTNESKELKFPPELKMLQLQVDDGKMYHIAFAMLMKADKVKTIPTSYFSTNLSKDQVAKLQELNDKMLENIKTVEANVEKSGFMKIKILNVLPLAPLEGAKEVIYSLGGRYIVDMGGMIAPMCGKAYFFERDGQLVVAIIATSDADGDFWSDISDKLFLTLEKNSAI